MSVSFHIMYWQKTEDAQKERRHKIHSTRKNSTAIRVTSVWSDQLSIPLLFSYDRILSMDIL